MDRTAAVLSILAVLILSGGLLYVFLSEDIDQRNATPTPTVESVPLATEPSTTMFEVPADWKTYTSEEYGFKVSYPEMLTVDEPVQIDGIRFFVLGPTQTEGTEMYDGISMNINTLDYQGETFEEFVNSEYEKMSNDDVTSNITEIQDMTIDGKKAYSFEVSSLGDFTHLYVDLGSNRYAYITYLVEDPTGVGYEQIVNNMLSSLSFTQ